ncbi:hypothetical protein [Microbacterium kunmingense]|uniref:hypothetical protein n=1 Tax=Microbacterium kunmingense TaxID=2915939 RepID=UPI003D733620
MTHTPSMKQLREDWISLMITSDGYSDAISEEMAEEQWDRALAAHNAEVLRAAAERMHQVTEVGNMFGGYDCLCGDPWLDTLGGCGEARRMRDEADRLLNHTDGSE